MKTQINNAVVTQFVAKAKPFLKKLFMIESIQSSKEFDNAASYLASLKEIKKLAEAKKNSIIVPIKQSIKETESLFKPFLSEVDEAEIRTKNLMLFYKEKVDKQLAKVDADLESGKIAKMSTYRGKLAQVDNIETSHAQLRTIKKLVIDDPNIIPREYLTPNNALITKALKEGKKVKGCHLEDTTSIAI